MPHFLAENALFSDIGKIFHPLFELFGLILAGIYSVIPNYGVAIIGLTIVIMLALTPITIKSTKSMLAMQRLQPEMKKLQAKYKGAENREQLNAEMMKLYRENGTSPFGACLPALLQTPFLIVLYSLIRGLSYGKLNKAGDVIKATPRYIPTGSKIYHNLVAAKGQMHFWFGMNLSDAPFSHHGGNQALHTIPYLVLIGMAMFLQYFQMRQMSSRNPQAAAANPQMQQMQKFFPLIFGFIYLKVPAGATIYMVVSSAIRIGTQEVMFRTGMVTPVGAEEREVSGTPPTKSTGGPAKKPAGRPPGKTGTPRKAVGPGASATGKGPAKEAGTSKPNPTDEGEPGTNGNGKAATPKKAPAAGKTGQSPPRAGNRTPAARRPTNGTGNGRRAGTGRGATNGNGQSAADDAANGTGAQKPKPQSRSRSKRTRKAR
jgi:YidC/Oxa1 family membrane protein insertase